MRIDELNIDLCRDKLRPRNARLILRDPHTLIPLADVEELSVEWGPFSTAADLPMLKEFLRIFTWPTNADNPTVPKSFVEGDTPEEVAFEVENEPFYDRWRMAFVRTRKQEVRPDVFEYFIVLTLRKGYVQSYAGGTLHILRLLDKEGNSVDIDGKTWTASTTSANPGLALTVEMRNVARQSVQEVVGGFPTTFAAATTIDDYTVPNGRTLYKTIADHRKEDDGSSTITAIYADEQFAFNGFEDSNVITERRIGYLWNIPRQLGEAISDEWDAESGTTRRGCTASLSGEGQGYINLVLTSKVGTKENLTSTWVPVSCDTFRRYHFAWGYTKDEIDTFIQDHDDAIDGTTLSPPSTGKIIRSRQVNVNNRGDGLYDAIITETSWADPTNPAVADYTITLDIGTKITVQKLYGYNWPLGAAGMGDATFKALFETGAPGKTHDLRIRRDEDDCSFDWEGTITTVTKIDSGQQGEAASGGVGLGNVVQAISRATAAQLNTAIDAYTPGIGKVLRVTLSPNDDETYNATFHEVAAQTPEHTGAVAIGDPGLGDSVASGHNATTTEVTAAIDNFSSGARKSLSIDMRASDDGGWDYFIREHTVNETADQSVANAAAGIGYSFRYGRNQDSAPAITAAVRKRISGGVSANDDGTVNHGLVEETVKETADADIETTGSTGIGTKMRYGRNQDSEPAITRDRLKRISGNVSANDDSTINHAITEETLVASDIVGGGASGIRAGSKGETLDVRVSRNDDPSTLNADAYPTANGQRVLLEATVDDAGNLHFQKTIAQKVEQNQTTQGGTPLFTRDIKHSVGDVGFDELDASSDAATEGQTVTWVGRLLADNSMEWQKQTEVANPASSSAVTPTLARLIPRRNSGGYTDKVEIFRNVELTNLVNACLDTDDYGIVERLLMNDDGTFDGIKRVRTYTVTTGGTSTGANVESATQFNLVKRVYKDDYTQYRDLTYTNIQDWFETDYSTALGRISGGYDGSDVSLVRVGGDEYWYAIKYPAATVDAWTDT